MDEVIKVYEKMRLAEAYRSGTINNIYDFRPSYSKEQYKQAISNGTVVKESKFPVYQETDGKITTLSTLDPENEEGIHRMDIVHNGLSNVPFEHNELRVNVRKDKGTLPKGYATNLAYEHFKNTGVPMTSSESHSDRGQESFIKLCRMAMADGHRVYHFKDGHLNELTANTLRSDTAFGKFQSNPNIIKEHLIISKHSLE